jgi:hydroxymethylpyrimidine/phosphomethylpyrimidine kinase
MHPAGVVTALTAQGEKGVTWWEPVDPQRVVEQLSGVLFGSPVAAVKVGMVGTTALVPPLVAALRRSTQVPLVLDPVLAASSGDPLLEGPLEDLAPLLRLATVVTPNRSELTALTGRDLGGMADVQAAARDLRDAGARAVLVKGGHAEGPPVDMLYDGIRYYEFAGSRVPVQHVRGTGCALATALACRLGLGSPLPEAVSAAKAYLTRRLEATYELGGRHRYLP